MDAKVLTQLLGYNAARRFQPEATLSFAGVAA
jgi:hypothetical protein